MRQTHEPLVRVGVRVGVGVRVRAKAKVRARLRVGARAGLPAGRALLRRGVFGTLLAGALVGLAAHVVVRVGWAIDGHAGGAPG